MSLPIIEVEGSPYNIGHEHGSKCKELIHGVINKFFEVMEAKTPDKISKDTYLTLSENYLQYAKEYAPDLIDEVRGIADGGDIDFEKVFCFNCIFEMYDVPHIPTLVKSLPGCTCFAASGDATANDDVFIGQNFDLEQAFQKYSIILKIKPENAPSALIYAFAGGIGFLGLNSAGIGLVMNNMVSSDHRQGVPFGFIARKILQKERVGDAIGAITSARRAKGITYMLADKNGELFGVEATATDCEVRCHVEGYAGHTNHYIQQKFRPYDLGYYEQSFSNSIVRWSRINKLLRKRFGKIEIEDLKEFAKDHVNYPYSICRHDGEDPLTRDTTLTSVIMKPRELSIWFTSGNPCENDYVTYEM